MFFILLCLLPKKIAAKVAAWYVGRVVKKFEQNVVLILRYGDVRQIRTTAVLIKRLGERFNSPEYIKLAENIDSVAEKLILKRIGF